MDKWQVLNRKCSISVFIVHGTSCPFTRREIRMFGTTMSWWAGRWRCWRVPCSLVSSIYSTPASSTTTTAVFAPSVVFYCIDFRDWVRKSWLSFIKLITWGCDSIHWWHWRGGNRKIGHMDIICQLSNLVECGTGQLEMGNSSPYLSTQLLPQITNDSWTTIAVQFMLANFVFRFPGQGWRRSNQVWFLDEGQIFSESLSSAACMSLCLGIQSQISSRTSWPDW